METEILKYEHYITECCPYCKSSKFVKIQTKKGGFFEFDKYCFECSNCRRKFDYAEHITTISKNSVEQVIKEALKNKLKVKEFRKKLTEFGIYIYL